MSDDSIAPFVSKDVDAGLELRALGLDRARYFLEQMQKIAASRRRYRPYWQGIAFGTFKGRSVYRRDHEDAFIIYVVETESDGATRVTLIHAGLVSEFPDRQSIVAVVTPRLRDFFK